MDETCNPLTTQSIEHFFSLIRRDYFIFKSLEKSLDITNLWIGRIGHTAARIARNHILHAAQFTRNSLQTPEASSTQCCDLLAFIHRLTSWECFQTHCFFFQIEKGRFSATPSGLVLFEYLNRLPLPSLSLLNYIAKTWKGKMKSKNHDLLSSCPVEKFMLCDTGLFRRKVKCWIPIRLLHMDRIENCV